MNESVAQVFNTTRNHDGDKMKVCPFHKYLISNVIHNFVMLWEEENVFYLFLTNIFTEYTERKSIR